MSSYLNITRSKVELIDVSRAEANKDKHNNTVKLWFLFQFSVLFGKL